MKTKQCSVCQLVKDILEFYPGRGKCKECFKEDTRKRWNSNRDKNNIKRRKQYAENPDKYRQQKREDYKKHSERYKERAKQWRLNNVDKRYEYEKRRWTEEQASLSSYLKTQRGGKCEKCGYDKNAVALDWHHRNPQEKKFNISKILITPKRYNEIIDEIKKCTLLCSNCHRVEHSKKKTILNTILSDRVTNRFLRYGIKLQ